MPRGEAHTKIRSDKNKFGVLHKMVTEEGAAGLRKRGTKSNCAEDEVAE